MYKRVRGDHWVISDVSGKKYPASECVYGVDLQENLIMHWSEASEYNHQFFIKSVIDIQSVDMNRPDNTDYNFITPPSAGDL